MEKKRERTQIRQIRKENGNITSDTTNTKKRERLLKATTRQQNGGPRRNEHILRKVQLSKMEQGRYRNMNKSITSNETETVI